MDVKYTITRKDLEGFIRFRDDIQVPLMIWEMEYFVRDERGAFLASERNESVYIYYDWKKKRNKRPGEIRYDYREASRRSS